MGGQYQQKCSKWSDCCSLECDKGYCKDSTLPSWLQAFPAMEDQLPLHSMSPIADDYLVPSLPDEQIRTMDSSPSDPAK
jgi:hypothetical protein